jgi:hypothetical protein
LCFSRPAESARNGVDLPARGGSAVISSPHLARFAVAESER